MARERKWWWLKKGKWGRPTESPKDTMFRVRLDEGTLNKLKIVSEEIGTSKSEVVRRGIEIQWEQLEKK